MAIGLRRKVRLDSRRERQAITRSKNGVYKRKEQERRKRRIVAKIKATENGDYSPEVASWIAAQLGKPVRQASADEIQALCA